MSQKRRRIAISDSECDDIPNCHSSKKYTNRARDRIKRKVFERFQQSTVAETVESSVVCPSRKPGKKKRKVIGEKHKRTNKFIGKRGERGPKTAQTHINKNGKVNNGNSEKRLTRKVGLYNHGKKSVHINRVNCEGTSNDGAQLCQKLQEIITGAKRDVYTIPKEPVEDSDECIIDDSFSRFCTSTNTSDHGHESITDSLCSEDKDFHDSEKVDIHQSPSYDVNGTQRYITSWLQRIEDDKANDLVPTVRKKRKEVAIESSNADGLHRLMSQILMELSHKFTAHLRSDMKNDFKKSSTYINSFHPWRRYAARSNYKLITGSEALNFLENTSKSMQFQTGTIMAQQSSKRRMEDLKGPLCMTIRPSLGGLQNRLASRYNCPDKQSPKYRYSTHSAESSSMQRHLSPLCVGEKKRNVYANVPLPSPTDVLMPHYTRDIQNERIISGSSPVEEYSYVYEDEFGQQYIEQDDEYVPLNANSCVSTYSTSTDIPVLQTPNSLIQLDTSDLDNAYHNMMPCSCSSPSTMVPNICSTKTVDRPNRFSDIRNPLLTHSSSSWCQLDACRSKAKCTTFSHGTVCNMRDSIHERLQHSEPQMIQQNLHSEDGFIYHQYPDNCNRRRYKDCNGNATYQYAISPQQQCSCSHSPNIHNHSF